MKKPSWGKNEGDAEEKEHTGKREETPESARCLDGPPSASRAKKALGVDS